MRKSATARSKRVLDADRNPAGSKLIRGYCRNALHMKYSLAKSTKWYIVTGKGREYLEPRRT